MTARKAAIPVRVRCEHRFADDGKQCGEWDVGAHVHQPLPCWNGWDLRHHDYAPPTSVILQIGNQRKRVRLAVSA